MSMPGTDERVVELRGQGLGEGTTRILQIAEQLGYTVATVGQGSYRLARSRRRLTGKQTESVLVSVYDDRGGTRARFVGPVDPALLQHLTNAERPARGMQPRRAAPARPVTQQPTSPPAAPSGTADQPAMPTPVDRPAPRPVVAPAGGLISAVPGAAARPPAPLPPPALVPAPQGETADLDERTLGDLRRESLPAPTVAEPGLVLPGNRFVSLAAPAVIGRDPDPTRGAPGAVPVPVAEPSLSKTHLAVSFGAGGIRVTDLHSSNGTIVELAGQRTPCAPGVEVIVPQGAALIAGALVIEVVGP